MSQDEHDPGAIDEHDSELEGGARRNQRLDDGLARSLGRPAPAAPAGSGGILRRLGARPALTAAAEQRLIDRAQAGDRSARADLVEAFLPAIGAVARTYRSTPSVQRVELLQEGVVGLLRALERYDAQRGVPFWAYASFWVRQAMQQLVSELTRPAVLSDRALRHLARIKDAHHDALAEGRPEPGRDELAQRTGLTPGQVDDLLAVDRAPRSLDEPVVGEEGAVGTFGDLLVDPLAEDEYEQVLGALRPGDLVGLLSGLSDRERAVLTARYGLDGPEHSLRQVAGTLGISAERVRQIERRALGKLAAAAGLRTPDDAEVAG